MTLGQHSRPGRKPVNQDFHGALLPEEPALSLKGVAVALADGIGSSDVSDVASSAAVHTFLTDYYCTSDAWSVKHSAQRVIAAVNSWLHAQTRRSPWAYERDRGYVCTLSALVLKGRVAHLFHVGDSRIWRVAGRGLEQLTEDHRVLLSAEQSYLGRALGVAEHVEIDYRAVPVEEGDVFVLTTDGVHDHVGAEAIAAAVAAAPDDLDRAAADIADRAHEAGSADNLTVQILRVDALPVGPADAFVEQPLELPPAPLLEPGAILDGYRVLRALHHSARSHVYLAAESGTGATVALKLPATDLRADPAAMRRFLMEEWVARRIDHPNVLKVPARTRRRSALYLVLEHVEGRTLAQWMRDHPGADLETVRAIVEQVGRALSAFHDREMVHQDLRPENVLVDAAGTATLIDFGSTRVAGLAELEPDSGGAAPLGTVQYSAPECLLGEVASPRADLFSLGVVAYQMLTGALPYGAEAARLRTRTQQRRLRYRPARERRPDIPGWIDGALRKAVHPFPDRRQESVSEFLHNLRHPDPALSGRRTVPLAERDPVLFWKVVAALLALAVLWLLLDRFDGGIAGSR